MSAWRRGRGGDCAECGWPREAHYPWPTCPDWPLTMSGQPSPGTAVSEGRQAQLVLTALGTAATALTEDALRCPHRLCQRCLARLALARDYAQLADTLRHDRPARAA